MLRHASFSAAIRLGPDDATTSRLNRARKAHCGTLGAEARAEADAMVGCYAFDVPSETFNLAPLHLVQTTRAGFRILEAGRVTDAEVSPFGCNRQLSVVRYAPVLAPSVAGTLVTRHFFELFHRTSVHRDGRPIHVLSWTLVEIVGSTAQHREHEILLETATAAWPPSYPSDALPSTVCSPPWRTAASTGDSARRPTARARWPPWTDSREALAGLRLRAAPPLRALTCIPFRY